MEVLRVASVLAVSNMAISVRKSLHSNSTRSMKSDAPFQKKYESDSMESIEVKTEHATLP